MAQYMCACVCVCMFIYVCERERSRGRKLISEKNNCDFEKRSKRRSKKKGKRKWGRVNKRVGCFWPRLKKVQTCSFKWFKFIAQFKSSFFACGFVFCFLFVDFGRNGYFFFAGPLGGVTGLPEVKPPYWYLAFFSDGFKICNKVYYKICIH